VTLVDTGETTMTGGRLKRVLPYLRKEEAFCFTYGDGLSDLDITQLIEFHRAQRVLGTVTAVQPAGRFGALEIDDGRVRGFDEKPRGDGAWTNGGFFVLSPAVEEYLTDDATVWEQEPVRALAARGQLASYRHDGFWHAMDTLRDRTVLEELWAAGEAPWRAWT
jgi:glucose-1-phosphate cytidylyltransferase